MSTHWGWSERPEPRQQSPTTGRAVAAIAGVLAIALVLGAGVWAWFHFRGGDGDGSATSVASPSFTGEPTRTVTVAAEKPEPAVTITAEPGPVHQRSPQGAPLDVNEGSLPCDGRGVLIVQTVKSNSPDFHGEIAAATTAHPDAVVLEPGACPSLRAHSDGADNYAVVIDYGTDLVSLCAAEIPGVRNARLLNNDVSYRSPC